jgi:hypothetical protein
MKAPVSIVFSAISMPLKYLAIARKNRKFRPEYGCFQLKSTKVCEE